MKQLTDKNFDYEVLNSTELVVVDFWAEWCGPCRMVAPVIDELSEEYNDVKFFGVDVDSSPNVADKQGIRNIPAILFFKKGQLIDRIVGAVPKPTIKNKIDALRQ
jgi:thioredoxin 1